MFLRPGLTVIHMVTFEEADKLNVHDTFDFCADWTKLNLVVD